MTLLTVQEAAALLRMNVGQVYTLCKRRSRVRSDNPLPVIRVNGNLRFSKESLEKWLGELEERT